MSEKDGGNAFPLTYQAYVGGGQYETKVIPGMSFRDYLAAKAMEGMIAKGTNSGYSWFLKTETEKGAALAYKMADAMIKERNK